MSITTVGIASSTTLGTAVTAGAANAKGSYAEITASTPHAAARMLVHIWDTDVTSAGNDDYLVDIATGAVESPTIIFADLLVSVVQTQFGHAAYDFPCDVAIGTRLSARVQCTRLSKVVHVSVVLMTGTTTPRTVTTYGANAADSGGVEVDGGGAANTKGAWVELTASSAATEALIVAVGNDATALGLSTVRVSGRDYFVDVGTGAALSETVVLANLHFQAESVAVPTPHHSGILPFSVAAGTRIAVRAQYNGATTTPDRLIDVVLYGVSTGSSSAYPPAIHDEFHSCGPEPTKPFRFASLVRRVTTWVAQGMPFTLLDTEDVPIFGRLFRSPRRPPYIPWRPQGMPETLTEPPPPPPSQRGPDRRRGRGGWPPVSVIEAMALLQRCGFDPRLRGGRTRAARPRRPGR